MKSCPELRNLKPGYPIYIRNTRGLDELTVVTTVERDSAGEVNAVVVHKSRSIRYSPVFLAGMESNFKIVDALNAGLDSAGLEKFFGELLKSAPVVVSGRLKDHRLSCVPRSSNRVAELVTVED